MSLNRFKDPKHIKWALKVKKRDQFTCQICEAQNVYLHSHHMNSFDIYIEDRYDVDNGVTLCQECHNRFHSQFGKGKNTKAQFEEFQRFINLIRKIAFQKNR